MFCEECGAQLDEGTLFCPECGNRIENEAPLFQNAEQEPANFAEKSNFNLKKWIAIGGLGIFVAVVCLMVFGVAKGWHIKHEWLEATCTEPEICVKGRETRGEALGHDWLEATCTEPEICTVCGEISGEALGHTYTEPTCMEASVCTICGETVGEALGHMWEGNLCLEPQICSVCGANGEMLGHEWNIEYATCDTDKMCNRCQTIEAYALGHELIDSGICKRCKEQVGIMLTASNFQPYFTLSPHTECREHTDNQGEEYYTYWYVMNIKDVNTQLKFHNVVVHVKMYLTTDISKGEGSAINGTKHEMTVTLDENGQVIKKSLSPYDMERQMIGKWYDRYDLMFYGYIYEIEGFCYDPNIATVVD